MGMLTSAKECQYVCIANGGDILWTNSKSAICMCGVSLWMCGVVYSWCWWWCKKRLQKSKFFGRKLRISDGQDAAGGGWCAGEVQSWCCYVQYISLHLSMCVLCVPCTYWCYGHQYLWASDRFQQLHYVWWHVQVSYTWPIAVATTSALHLGSVVDLWMIILIQWYDVLVQKMNHHEWSSKTAAKMTYMQTVHEGHMR
jgi:hypothetical protein